MSEHGIYRTTNLTLVDGQQSRFGLTQDGALRISAATGNTAASPSFAQTSATPSTASSALSGTIAASGGTQAIAMTNTTRSEVLNPSTGTLWASWGTPAVNGAGSFQINAGGAYNVPDRAAGTLTLLSTAASQPYTVNRFS